MLQLQHDISAIDANNNVLRGLQPCRVVRNGYRELKELSWKIGLRPQKS
jgi:hypothetical protein